MALLTKSPATASHSVLQMWNNTTQCKNAFVNTLFVKELYWSNQEYLQLDLSNRCVLFTSRCGASALVPEMLS